MEPFIFEQHIDFCIVTLLPEAQYLGVPLDEVSYDALIWQDERTKPTYQQLRDIFESDVKTQLEALSND